MAEDRRRNDRQLLAARQVGIEPEESITDANRSLIAATVENATTGGAHLATAAYNVAMAQYDWQLLAAGMNLAVSLVAVGQSCLAHSKRC